MTNTAILLVEDNPDDELLTLRALKKNNVTGGVVDSLPEIRQALQDQVTGTVRWTDCMETLLDRGCDLFIELGPGGVLAGLMGRIRKGVEVISVTDAASLHGCAERLRASA